jgi:RNA polymerase sigma-70 factor (ECF subfamily)
MDDREEKRLIERAAGGDAGAFEALVGKHYETMFKMAYKWCANRQDAEDITQEACIRLARGIESFRHECAFTSWLYRLTINTAKDWYKKQNRHAGSSDGLDKAAIDEKSESAVYAQQVLAAISRLPDGEKEALLLVLHEGLTHKEAARLLKCKESTVSWRIHEARKKLGAAFEQEKSYG